VGRVDEPVPRRPASTAVRLLEAATALYALAALASLAGGWWWVFELASHFRPQLAVAGAGIAVGLALAGPRVVPALIAGGLAGANAVPVLPYYADLAVGAGARAAPAPAADTRVVTLNLNHERADRAAIARLVRLSRPDIVLVTEFTAPPVGRFGELAEWLPFEVGSPVAGAHQLLLLSRHPIVAARWRYPVGPGHPLLEARVCREAPPAPGCLVVVALHAPRPLVGRGLPNRALLAAAAERAAAVADGRVIVIGDLNTTPYAPRFAALLDRGGLRDAARGVRWRPTWPSRLPLLGLAIDHVLIGPALRAVEARVLPGIGSDHYPLAVGLSTAAGGG